MNDCNHNYYMININIISQNLINIFNILCQIISNLINYNNFQVVNNNESQYFKSQITSFIEHNQKH